MKSLITGAAGAIGSTLVKGMKEKHTLRGLDVNPMPDLEDVVQGDVSDFDTLLKATEGMDAVIHLTGNDSQWGEVLQNALSGTSPCADHMF